MDLERFFSLEGKVALVTGCRAGLGRAAAVGLATAGADLVLHAHHDELDETAAEVVACSGRTPLRWVADLGRPDELEGQVSELLASTRVDILVNNAAAFVREQATELSFTRWREVMAVNLDAPWLLSQWIGATMIERGAGKIINVSSLAGLQGGVRRSGYAVSKHGMIGMTKALSNEWAGFNVQVNAIAPGFFDSGRPNTVIGDPAVLARIPAGRWGEPFEIAGPIVFLASKAADYVSGHVLVVDGGWFAR